jgi:hypothetical protein
MKSSTDTPFAIAPATAPSYYRCAYHRSAHQLALAAKKEGDAPAALRLSSITPPDVYHPADVFGRGFRYRPGKKRFFI